MDARIHGTAIVVAAMGLESAIFQRNRRAIKGLEAMTRDVWLCNFRSWRERLFFARFFSGSGRPGLADARLAGYLCPSCPFPWWALPGSRGIWPRVERSPPTLREPPMRDSGLSLTPLRKAVGLQLGAHGFIQGTTSGWKVC